MTDRLHFTDSDEANVLLVEDPFALLVGFALDQQVTVQKAFAGPLVLRERLGTLEPARVATAQLEPIFRERPAIHRFPGSMAKRVRDLRGATSPSATTATPRGCGPTPARRRSSRRTCRRCPASAR